MLIKPGNLRNLFRFKGSQEKLALFVSFIFDTCVESYWKILELTLLEFTGRSCGWIKCPARHGETCFLNNDVSISVCEKRRLGGLIVRPNLTQKGKDLEIICGGTVKNVKYLRLQRGWSKLTRILLASSAQSGGFLVQVGLH